MRDTHVTCAGDPWRLGIQAGSGNVGMPSVPLAKLSDCFGLTSTCFACVSARAKWYLQGLGELRSTTCPAEQAAGLLGGLPPGPWGLTVGICG
jgi:hypothetical protein